jgi:polyisoprenoid-binding protein YceI
MTSRRFAASLAAFALFLPVCAAAAVSQNVADLKAGHYEIDKQHASVIAKVLHLGVSLYTVRFDSFDASFDYDPAHPTAARVTASVDPASLDVNADYGRKFAEDFLKAAEFPKITFVSTQIQPGAGNSGTMTGAMTFMGVTRPVTFDVTFVGAGHEPLPLPLGREAAGFSAATQIKRSDFGSTYLSDFVGDEVTIQIEGEFARR